MSAAGPDVWSDDLACGLERVFGAFLPKGG